MNAVIKAITSGSPAAKTAIAPGDELYKINGNVVGDVLDYKFLSYDSSLALELKDISGRMKLVRIKKPDGVDIGLEFESFLMDSERSCANKCIFCFIDQLPDGMRKSLYYKDDDVRLSFFQGNYITLTNLSKDDIERICRLRVSPINVSVHTFEPELRTFMLGTKKAATGIESLRVLADAGIIINCQIVCCPGINDGVELSKTIKGLIGLGPGINSVSIVPVGLTRHRNGLAPLSPVDRKLALEIVRMVGHYGELCLKRRGSRVFYCADELYMKAGLRLPPHDFYEDYPQLENGVGMMRLFVTEFQRALRMQNVECRIDEASRFSVATGLLSKRHLTNLLKMATANHDKITCSVYGVRNNFFGDDVTVSGLVTGGDIISQIKGLPLGDRLLIPQNMLRYGEEVFLDDVTVSDVSNAIGIPIRVVKQDGADLLQAFLGN